MGYRILKIRLKKGINPNEAIEDLATALDLARVIINHPESNAFTKKVAIGIIDDALDNCEEFDLNTGQQENSG